MSKIEESKSHKMCLEQTRKETLAQVMKIIEKQTTLMALEDWRTMNNCSWDGVFQELRQKIKALGDKK